MKKMILALIVLSTCFSACSGTQILESVLGGGSSDKPVSNSEIIQGLKQALQVGITNGADIVSKTDGYFGNNLIKIPFPPEAQKIANTMNDIGMSKEVDKVVLSLNRAAELAAKEAKAVFITAITQMTISDAMNILKGEPNAATNYLKHTTGAHLTAKFQPIINNSLESVNATKYWDDVITRYNKIPFVQKQNPDLSDFVTTKAIDGLFTMVEKEEAKIRKDPLARTTDLLKRVFKLQDK